MNVGSQSLSLLWTEIESILNSSRGASTNYKASQSSCYLNPSKPRRPEPRGFSFVSFSADSVSYKEQQRLRKLRPAGNQRASFWTALDPRFNDDFSRERLEAEGGADASDYSTVFLPWGPNWTAEKVKPTKQCREGLSESQCRSSFCYLNLSFD